MGENANHVASTCGSKNNKKLFPQKLWDLINDKRYNFCLRWSEDGQLVYLNRDEFENSYLKTSENQFHTQKAISFVRQMNMYGFRKVDDCYYENDNFKRGCEHLLKNMIRKHPNKSSSAGHPMASDIISSLAHHHINHNNHSHHQQLRLSPTTLLQQQPHHRHHHHNQQQQQLQLQQQQHRHHQLHLHQANSTTSSSSPTAAEAAVASAAAAVVASALAQHQQQQIVTTASATNTINSLDSRQRLAAATAAAFGAQAKLNGETPMICITTTITSNNSDAITTMAANATTNTTTTTADNYSNQIQENLLAQMRQQQVLLCDDERVNDDSLSSLGEYCSLAGGSQTASEEQTALEAQQQCNNEVLNFTGDLKFAQQALQQQMQRQQQSQSQAQHSQQQQQPQQQQQQHVQLTVQQYANLYGLDPAFLNQFRALQAAGQLANETITTAASPSINGLNSLVNISGLPTTTTTTTSMSSSNLNGNAAVTAAAALATQPGNLQNNLLLNALIALGILSITSLTQRG